MNVKQFENWFHSKSKIYCHRKIKAFPIERDKYLIRILEEETETSPLSKARPCRTQYLITLHESVNNKTQVWS